MSQFFEYIQHISQSQSYISAMVVEGPLTGAKSLFSDGRWVLPAPHPLFEQLALRLLPCPASRLVTIGEHKVFCEPLSDQPSLVICGAGHVSMPMIRMGKMLGFHVTVIDDRAQFCSAAKAAGADHVICAPFNDGLASLLPSQVRYFICVTRGHAYDLECLEQILPMPHCYVGMMGSRVRAAKVAETLLSQGFSQDQVDEIHMPIGLAISAQTPEEIAVSVMAEIISIKNTRFASAFYSSDMLKALCDSPCILAVILERTGSAPRAAGTKMVVLPDGRCIGTVGGGIAEARITSLALKCFETRQSAVLEVSMNGQEAARDGMVCGGHIKVYIEPENL